MSFSNGVDTYLYQRKNSQEFFDPHTTGGKVKVIIKMARRAKNEVGKRSKSKQRDKIVVSKVSFPSNTNSGFSPWHYSGSVSAGVKRSRFPCQRNLEKNRF